MTPRRSVGARHRDRRAARAQLGRARSFRSWVSCGSSWPAKAGITRPTRSTTFLSFVFRVARRPPNSSRASCNFFRRSRRSCRCRSRCRSSPERRARRIPGRLRATVASTAASCRRCDRGKKSTASSPQRWAVSYARCTESTSRRWRPAAFRETRSAGSTISG